MKMTKRRIFWLIFIVLFFIILLSQVQIPKVKFIELPPDEVIVTLKRDFQEIFPEKYKEAKAAMADLRNGDYFVLRLAIDEHAEKILLDALSNEEQEIFPHNIQEDYRLHGRYFPSWFKQPILKGFIAGSMSPKNKHRQCWNSISHLYIDNSNLNNIILYMDGFINNK
jgi:hypothetical protein